MKRRQIKLPRLDAYKKARSELIWRTQRKGEVCLLIKVSRGISQEYTYFAWIYPDLAFIATVSISMSAFSMIIIS